MINLKKLAVGIRSINDLKKIQSLKLQQNNEIFVKTRNKPARKSEILDGGSIYWIIRGVMSARQNIIDLAEVQRADGQVACGLVLSPDLVATVPTKMRIFQGWRYLETEDAPADMNDPVDESMPPALLAELRELGVL